MPPILSNPSRPMKPTRTLQCVESLIRKNTVLKLHGTRRRGFINDRLATQRTVITLCSLFYAPDTDDPTKNWAYHAAKLIQTVTAFTRAYWTHNLKNPAVRLGVKRDDFFEAFFWFDENAFKQGADCLFVLSILVKQDGLQVMAIKKDSQPIPMKDSYLRNSAKAVSARVKDAHRRTKQEDPSLMIGMAQSFLGVPKIGRTDTCVMYHNAAVENAENAVEELGLGNMTLDASDETPPLPVRAKAVTFNIQEDEAVVGIPVVFDLSVM